MKNLCELNSCFIQILENQIVQIRSLESRELFILSLSFRPPFISTMLKKTENLIDIFSVYFPSLHQLSVSNATHVTLRNVDFNLNGNISCEVTTESPSFYTGTATSVLQVVGEFESVAKNNNMKSE